MSEEQVEHSAATHCYAVDEMRALRAMSQLVKMFESESRLCLKPCNIGLHGGKAINEARASTMRWAASMVQSKITDLLAADQA